MEFHVAPNRIVTWTGPNGTAHRVRCALGRSFIGVKQREGDGVTPRGRWRLKKVLFRADRLAVPQTVLTCQSIERNDGWCDDPGDAAYNQPIKLPYRASFEDLWRDDALYDIVVELGYNDDPVIANKGSAIFLHIAQPGYGDTEGCVALAPDDLLALLAACDGDDWLVIG